MRGTKLLKFLWLLALGLLAACNGGPPPPDLSLQSVSPQNPSVIQGQSLTLTLTFTSQNGFQGQVGLQVTEGGQTPGWLSFSPQSASLNVPKGGQAQLPLQVQVSQSAPLGSHTLKLRATYGNQAAEKDLTLTVNPPPDFTISLNPTSLTVQQGQSGQTTLTLTPQNGFTGNVTLALEKQDGTPAPSGITLNPTSVAVTGSNPATQELTLGVGESVAPGTYALQVKATLGSLTKTANLTLTVTAPPDFTLSLDPTSLTVQQGGSGITQLTLTPQNGFTGPVTLSLEDQNGNAPSGITLNPASVTVSGSSPVAQTLTLSVGTGVAPGTYALRVKATSGSLTRTANLSLEAIRLTLDWQPLVAATGPDGTDGPITLTGTLEGNPSGTLELQLAYRPKGGEWGAWQTVAQLQVQGNQVQATIQGLDLPVGLDGLGKQVRARVAAGGQTLIQSGDYTLLRYRPLWSQAPGQGFVSQVEFAAGGSLACGYGTKQDNSAHVVYCVDAQTGEPRWTYSLPIAFPLYDVFPAEDRKVYVVAGLTGVRVLQNGAQLAQYDLSGDFAYVTALAVEGDTLYVAGSRWVNIGCGNILRARLAKYQMSGGSLTQLALHDPTPQDLQEITTPGQCSSYRIYNYSSIPALRLEGGKLYVPFAIGDTYDSNTGQVTYSHCVGFLRLDAATFARDWLTRPTRPGANGESTWQRDCPGSSWTPVGFRLTFNINPSYLIYFTLYNFDLGDTQLYARYMGQEVLRKEDGAKETLTGDDPYLLFLPGGFVRFRQVGTYFEARPGGTEGPYRLAGWESDLPRIYKDAQGRVYVYGHRNGELRVARIR